MLCVGAVLIGSPCYSHILSTWVDSVQRLAWRKGTLRFHKKIILQLIYTEIIAEHVENVSQRKPFTSKFFRSSVILSLHCGCELNLTNRTKKMGADRTDVLLEDVEDMKFCSVFKGLQRNLTPYHTQKKSHYHQKCSIIPLSHLIKIWWTAATMRLTLIWQQDNHGRQMASNSITGVGHVMSDSLLTLTGCTRCWQTRIDPGHRECWCIIVQIRMGLVPFTFDQQFRRGGPTNSGKKTPV